MRQIFVSLFVLLNVITTTHPATAMPERCATAEGSASAWIAWSQPRPGHLRLTLHDLGGARVWTLVDRGQPAGPGRALWDGRDARGIRVRPGTYFARLESPDEQRTRRIVVLH